MNIPRLWMPLSLTAFLTICPAAPAQTARSAAIRTAASSAYSANKTDLEPVALNALKTMSSQLQAATSFSFTARISREEPGTNGQMLDFMKTVRIEVQRPSRMRLETIGGRSDVDLWCDGKTVTLMPASGKFYTTLAAGPTLDATLEMLKSKAQNHTPLLPFLLADPYARLSDGLHTANEVGVVNDGNDQLLHLAFTEPDADWQLWLTGPNQVLPRRMAVIFKKIAGQPRLSVEFSDWNLNAEIPADAFTFLKPQGATPVSFDSLRYRRFPSESASASSRTKSEER